jgi:diguanylate cyclase (GGDEF)-like protein
MIRRRFVMPPRFLTSDRFALPFRAVMSGFVLLALLWLAGPVQASQSLSEPVLISDQTQQPLSSQLSVLRDSESSLSLSEVRQLAAEGAFRSLAGEGKGATNFGLTSDTIWLHGTLKTASQLPSDWWLEVAHGSLDWVTLYWGQSGQPLTALHSGDRIPWSQQPGWHRHHLFPMRLSPDTDYEFYLKVRSEGTLTIPVTLWQPEARWQLDQTSYMVLGMYYGLLLGLMFYNFFLFFSLRDSLYLLYVGFIGSLAVGQAGLSGLTGQFLWPDQAWLAHLSPTGGVSVAGMFGALFAQRFLQSTAKRLRVRWLMPLISAVYLFSFVSAALGFYALAAVTVNLVSLVFALSALTIGAVSLHDRVPGARFFVLAWASLLTGVVVIALHNIGVLPSNGITNNALFIGSAFEMVLLSLALADRVHSIQKARDEAREQVLETRQQMVEQFKNSERLLEDRVQARTQQLEETNQRLRVSQKQLAHQARHDSLTGVYNRFGLYEQLEDRIACGDPLTLVMMDLNRFKQINDECGHAAGDLVLQTVCQRLAQAVPENAVFGRLGGDEFLALLPDPPDEAQLNQWLADWQEQVMAPVTLENGESVWVGISFGQVHFPEDGDQVDTLMAKADQGMYQHKKDQSSR